MWAYLIARYSDRIIFVSKAVRIDFGKTDKGVVIYDAMNFEKNFCPERPNDRKKIKFIYPSNFILGKGQQYALESFSLVCNEFPNIELTFIGGTMNKNSNIKFKSKLVVEAKKRNIFHKINFLDFTNNILEEICKHDVVLMFSESESYSMVCLEAAALKKPIIATKCGGPSEIIVNNYSGFLVDNKNIDEMCKAMKTLINDYSLCKEMGNEAYKYCREKFSISEGRKRILEVYESV
ncbi:glycosyltransferase [Ekhidna sp.]